jgi:hypothetical protein
MLVVPGIGSLVTNRIGATKEMKIKRKRKRGMPQNVLI